MIVDDDKDIVEVIETYLTLEGHDVIAKAFDGVEALQKYRELRQEIDFILLDQRMPRKTGLEVLTEILEMNPSMQIIFISADYTLKEKALESGAKGFLEKPIAFPELFQLLTS